MDKREITIGLSDLIQIIKKNLVFILLSGFLLGVSFGTVTHFFVTPKYQSNTKSLVINQQDSKSLTYSDFQSSTQFIEDYKEVVKSRSILKAVIDKLQLTESLTELEDMIDVSIVNSTHHLKITATTDTPEKSQLIAEEITNTASEMFEKAMKIQAVNIIDHANLPEYPSSPNLKLNVLLGVITGWVLSSIIILTRKLLDDKIYTTEELAEQFGYPILGTIPYDGASNRNVKRKKYGKKR